MKKETIAVLFGGRSAEHEISIITALQAILAIDSTRYSVVPVYLGLNGRWYTGDPLFDRSFYRKLPEAHSQLDEIALLPNTDRGFVYLPSLEPLPVDVCFFAFHGQFGEDGCVQGLVELADIPYTGCGVLSSAVNMSKYHTKAIVQAHGIPTLPSVLLHKKEAISHFRQAREKIFNTLAYPLFVKPNHLGSSIGVSPAHNEQELNAALAKVFQYDDKALVEPCIEHLLELNISVLQGDPPVISPIEMPIASEKVLSYEDKYTREGSKTSSRGMAGLTRVIDPEDLDPAIKKQGEDYALKAFKALDCSGVCRIDMIYDIKKGILYFNELNPIPGSLSFYLWEKSQPQMLYTELLERLIRQAKERKAMQQSLIREFGFHAL